LVLFTLAPVAAQGTSSSRVTVGDGEEGGTSRAVIDTRAINDTVGNQDTIARGSLAGNIPADGGQGEDTSAVATTSVDAVACRVAIIVVAQIAVLGPVTARGSVLHGISGTLALVAFAQSTLVGSRAAILRISDLDKGAIASSEIFDVGTVLAFLEVIQITSTVEASETLAFRVATRLGGIARNSTSASLSIGNWLRLVGIASA
jgi:hypothetical protein